MKRTFTILFFLFFISLYGKAQDKFGIKAGMNSSTANNSINEGAQGKLAPHVGIYVESRAGKVLSLQPEVLYSAKGYKKTTFSGNPDGQVNLNYLNVAFLFKFYVFKGLNLSVGPQTGLLVAAKETTFMRSYTGQTTTITESGKDNYDIFDYGLNFGLGYQFEKGFNLGLRYDKGLAHIKAVNDPYREMRIRQNIGKMTNEVMQFYVAYSF